MCKEEVSIKKEIARLRKAIKSAEEKIKAVKALCRHEMYELAYWSNRPISHVPARICAECGELLEYCPIDSEEYVHVVKTNGFCTQEPKPYRGPY